ncbi:WW domain-binding protein 1-like isoform X2 [Gigantopelta aegis]|uniref:WW domain-binding protein 1-like isoform X2 n=1 Tax=Gigantopelta aegis TaxID=1735272 RepID=UPI001B88D183|nr:WW domain-binding protein 1-like isoform X2 [Gigantopelta aegis]
MAAKTVTFVSCFFLSLSQVLAYYCDSKRCNEDEYCCGDNLCCTSYKVWELWYFWFGLVFFLMLLSTCTCLWRFRQNQGLIFISGFNYSPLRSESPPRSCSASEPDLIPQSDCCGNRPYFASISHPPPAYSSAKLSKTLPTDPPPSYSEVIGGPGINGT